MTPQTRGRIIREAANRCYRLSKEISDWDELPMSEVTPKPEIQYLIELQIREVIETFLHDQRIEQRLQQAQEDRIHAASK